MADNELKHHKRSRAFNNKMAGLAMKAMGVSTPDERKEIAKYLLDYTTDSTCVLKAKTEEPIFVLQVGDPMAKLALAQWIVDSKKAKMHSDKMDDALECLREFKAYQKPN